MTGQYRFDPEGKITVVHTDAGERRTPEVQYTLDQLAKDTRNALAWGVDNEMPDEDPVDYQPDEQVSLIWD